MSFVTFDRTPDRRKLRQFGLAAGLLLPLAGWLTSGQPAVVWVGAGLGLLAGLLAVARPRWLHWPFVLLSLVTIPIGLVVGEVLMAFTYFCVVVPIGLFRRMARRDDLQLKLDRQAESYWHDRGAAPPTVSYYRQW